MRSCREKLDGLALENGANASLMMSRYVKELYVKGMQGESSTRVQELRVSLFEAMKKAALKAAPLYTEAFTSRREVLAGTVTFQRAKTIQPLIAGLGSSNVLDTGLTLNPTYGIPMLPGSSIKGITAHYAAGVIEPELYGLLFGHSDDKEQEAGFIRFYDAWLVPESIKGALKHDVMTPHHSGQDVPSDFDEPVPVRFLHVSGTFEIGIACEDPDPKTREEWIDFVFILICEALKNYGIGGKTRSGYGRMELELTDAQKKMIAEREAENRRHEEEGRRQKELAAKSEKFRAMGYAFSEGDTVKVRCTGLKEKKGKTKREFIIIGNTDGKAVRWDTVPSVSKDEEFDAVIVRIDTTSKAYILKKID